MGSISSVPVAIMRGEGLVSDDVRRLRKEKVPVRYELAVWADEHLPIGYTATVLPKTAKIDGHIDGLVDASQFDEQLLTLETQAGQRLRFFITGPGGEIAVEDWEE